MKPSQAPSESYLCQNFVVVGNSGLKSKFFASATFLAAQGWLLSGEFTRKSPEIIFLHQADVSQGRALFLWLASKGQVERLRLWQERYTRC